MPSGKQHKFIRISDLENAFEAQLLSSILTEHDIAFEVRSHHDTAYDGLYQMQKGWGEIWAPHGDRAIILEIIEQIRSQLPDTKNS